MCNDKLYFRKTKQPLGLGKNNNKKAMPHLLLKKMGGEDFWFHLSWYYSKHKSSAVIAQFFVFSVCTVHGFFFILFHI